MSHNYIAILLRKYNTYIRTTAASIARTVIQYGLAHTCKFSDNYFLPSLFTSPTNSRGYR
jgi:hypothetical protein